MKNSFALTSLSAAYSVRLTILVLTSLVAGTTASSPRAMVGEGTSSAPPHRQPAHGATSIPFLKDDRAIEHLKIRGEYESLAAAFTAACYAVKPIEGLLDQRAKSPLVWAQNPAQGIHSSYSTEGLTVSVRTSQNGEAPVHTVGWRLRSLGYGAAQIPVPAGILHVEGPRVELSRSAPALTEWFKNEPAGLEHGFILPQRPAGNPHGESLRLVLAVTGGLRPQVDAGGQSLTLRDAAGHTVLTYAKLKVWDASGTELPAALDVDQAEGAATLSVVDATARYPLTIDPTFTQHTYLKASNPGGADPERDFVNGDRFGNSVSISGDTVVIGAPGEDSGATGVNGDENNDSVFGAGAAYVFVRTGGTWVQQAYLKAAITDGSTDSFGAAVAVSGDTILIGSIGEDSNATGVNGDATNNDASASGAAYVFVRNGTNWSQQAYLKASNTGGNDFFGSSVAVSGDTAVVGAVREDSNAKGVNGNGGNNSSIDSGAAYVFVRDGTTWTQQAYLKASNSGADDRFGGSVAVSGNTIVVGASQEDSTATGVDGSDDNDGFDSGAAYIFVRNGTTWTQQSYLKPGGLEEFGFTDGSGFGRSVGISGDTVVVGASNQDNENGLVYVFTRNGTAWSEQARLTGSGEAFSFAHFGTSVAVSGDTLAVSAQGTQVGYAFHRSGTVWAEVAKLKPSNPGEADNFGQSISVSIDTVVVGAPFEQSNAAGVNGDSTNNSLNEAGAAYVFVVPASATPEIAVEQPPGTSLLDAGSQAFGSINVGANTSLTFTIKNTGAGDLTGLQINIDGTDAALFTVTGNPTAPVAGPAGSTTFTVRFAPTSAGVKTAALHLSSNDADENPFDLTLTGEGVTLNAPPTLILPSSPVSSEATSGAGAVVSFTVTANDAEDGPLTPLVSPASGSTFPLGDTVVNITATDSAKAVTSGSFIVRVLDTTAPLLTLPSSPVTVATTSTAGSPVTFAVSATDLVSGTVTATANPPSGSLFALGDTTVNVSASDALGNVAMGSFVVRVIGAPEIALEQPAGTTLATGGVHDFGSLNVGETRNLTFTIKNTGAADLTGLALTIDGADAGLFTVVVSPTAPVAGPTGSTIFTVQFAPTTAGSKSAVLHLANNDADENPFNLTLTGNGAASVNRSPVFAGYSLRLPQNQVATITQLELLAKASDPDGDAVTISSASALSAAGGRVALTSTLLSYSPPLNHIGADSFAITLSDGRGGFTEGTILVTLTVDQLQVLPGGPVQACFTGQPGHSYAIQRSTDLTEWSTIQTISATVSGDICFTDQNPPPAAAFYRARLVP